MDLLEVGKIVNTHGLREVKLRSFLGPIIPKCLKI